MKINLTREEVVVLLQILPICNERLESFCSQPKRIKQGKEYKANLKKFRERLDSVSCKINDAFGIYIESEEYLNTL
jgi:hypothetical protein